MSLARLALLSIVLTSTLATPAPAACPPYTIDYGHGQCVPIGGSGFPRGGIGSGPDLRDTRGTRDDKPKNVPPLTTTTTSSGDKVSQPKNKAVLRATPCPPDTYRTSTGCKPLSARPRN
jgi:hypothetical protein